MVANILVVIMFLNGQPTDTRVFVFPTEEACGAKLQELRSGKLKIDGLPPGTVFGASCNKPLIPGGQGV